MNGSDVEAAFAAMVKAGRTRLGMSQKRLAHELTRVYGLGIYPTAITKIERGNQGIRLGEAVAMARLLDLDLSSLVAVDVPHQVEQARLRVEELRREVADAEARLDALRSFHYAALHLREQIESGEGQVAS